MPSAAPSAGWLIIAGAGETGQTSEVTENLPDRKSQNAELDIARIHVAIDDALQTLLDKSGREDDFDLKVELALRTIREELQKLRESRGRK